MEKMYLNFIILHWMTFVSNTKDLAGCKYFPTACGVKVVPNILVFHLTTYTTLKFTINNDIISQMRSLQCGLHQTSHPFHSENKLFFFHDTNGTQSHYMIKIKLLFFISLCTFEEVNLLLKKNLRLISVNCSCRAQVGNTSLECPCLTGFRCVLDATQLI